MGSSKTMINDLTQGNVVKKLLIFAYPFALSNLVQVVYGIIDMIIIGRYVGSTGLSGVAIGFDLLNFFMMLGMGLATAGQIIISQYVGRGDRQGLNSVIGTLFTFIISTALTLSIIALSLTNTFLGIMKIPGEAYAQGRIYFIVCLSGLVFNYGYNVVSAILRGMGESKRPFVFIAISAVTNIILDLLFVALFKLDTFGAALATILSQAFSFILSIIYLYKKRESFGFDFKPKSFRINRIQLGLILKIGLFMALQNAALSISFIIVNSHINAYGVIASAVTGVGNRLNQFIAIASQAVGMASSAMIGQNFGAGKFDRVKKIVHTTLVICLGFSAFFSAIYLLIPKELFSLFSSDPEVLALAPSYAKIGVLGIMCFAFMSPYMSMVNGIGFAAFTFTAGFVEGLLSRVGLALLFGVALNMGIQGFWLGNALATIITFLMTVTYFYSGRWEKRRQLVN